MTQTPAGTIILTSASAAEVEFGDTHNDATFGLSPPRSPEVLAANRDFFVSIAWSALALVPALLLIWYFSRSEKPKKSSTVPRILLIGPSGSGKTALFTRWTGNPPIETVTSVVVNTGRFKGEGLPALQLLVDIPGHGKLEHLAHEQLRGSGVRAVLFVLDAAAGQGAIADAARRLYSVLTITEPRHVPVLVASNKSDLFNTFSTKKITALLQDEIEELRRSRARGLSEVGSDEAEVPWIGVEDKFEFGHLEAPVAVLDGSVLGKRTQKWEEWLADYASR